MGEKQFTLNLMKKPSEIEMDGKMISKYDVVRLLNEQQDTIRKLQDLCGQSDYENAKLRLKNKKLQDKIDMLCEKYDYPNEKDKTKVVKNDKQN